MDWREIVKNATDLPSLYERLERGANDMFVKSLNLVGNQLLFMAKEASKRILIIVSKRHEENDFLGSLVDLGSFTVKEAPLHSENAQVLRNMLPWTAPQAFGPRGISMGLGDRLGLASPGHLKTITGTLVRPVLAQQSMRELELTNRTYGNVLDAATWAVFQEGYQEGYGADGDHLKRIEDIQAALDLGFSMITLDCSEHIDDSISNLTDSQVLTRYNQLPSARRETFEQLYKDQHGQLQSGTIIEMQPKTYERMILTYHQALDFIEEVFKQVIAKLDRTIDFEISIDEVATPTTPQDHFFVASELQERDIKVSSIAPRFCGQFEKGIDYIGDLQEFEEEFKVHADIAKHFGYKLSIHSGSDKFSVFPIIGKHAAMAGYHIKTAGTNWLEAIRVIASVDPDLYRKLHSKALNSLDAARKYYIVSLDLNKIPRISELEDHELVKLLDQDDARQLLHITYGFMLRDPRLREGIYAALRENEEIYEEFLKVHIGRHLELLGI